LTKTCLQSGLNVLVEHPLTTTVADAEEICRIASRSHGHVFVMRQRRYLDSVQFLNSVIKNGLLGKVNEISANMFWNRSISYFRNKPWQSQKGSGGVVLNQFSHFLDIMLYLFGDVFEVSGILGNLRHQIPVEDTAKGVISFASGVKADFLCTIAAPEGINLASLTVSGDRGWVRLGGKAWEKVEECSGDALPKAFSWEVTTGGGEHADYLYRVHSKLLGNDSEVVDASEGFRAVRLIDMIYKNFDQVDGELSNYIGDSLIWK
jgi:predicted dehydrogenase